MSRDHTKQNGTVADVLEAARSAMGSLTKGAVELEVRLQQVGAEGWFRLARRLLKVEAPSRAWTPADLNRSIVVLRQLPDRVSLLRTTEYLVAAGVLKAQPPRFSTKRSLVRPARVEGGPSAPPQAVAASAEAPSDRDFKHTTAASYPAGTPPSRTMVLEPTPSTVTGTSAGRPRRLTRRSATSINTSSGTCVSCFSASEACASA